VEYEVHISRETIILVWKTTSKSSINVRFNRTSSSRFDRFCSSFPNQSDSFPCDMNLIFYEQLEENSTASSWNMRSIRQGKLSIWSKKLVFFEVIFFGSFIIGTPKIIAMHRWLGVLQRCNSGQQKKFARDWTVLEGYLELEGLLQNLAGRRPLLTLCETLFPRVFWACRNPATDMCQNVLDLWQICTCPPEANHIYFFKVL